MDRETTEVRIRVEEAETAIQQEEDNISNAEKAELTSTKPETTFEDMSNAIGDSLSDLASSNNGEDWEDEDDDEGDPELGKLSGNDEPRWVMGTISETVEHRMECFRQKQMKLDKLTRPGWGDVADYICPRGKMYGIT